MVPWTDEMEKLGEIAFNAVVETLHVNGEPTVGQADWKTMKFINKLAWIEGASAVEREVRKRMETEVRIDH